MTQASVPACPDVVCLTGLRLVTRIGVSEEERAVPQSVAATIRMEPSSGTLCRTGDSLEHTIDYRAVSVAVRELAAKGERRLIEQLAEDIGDCILASFLVARVHVEICKFILPDTASVSVTLTKSANDPPA